MISRAEAKCDSDCIRKCEELKSQIWKKLNDMELKHRQLQSKLEARDDVGASIKEPIADSEKFCG